MTNYRIDRIDTHRRRI